MNGWRWEPQCGGLWATFACMLFLYLYISCCSCKHFLCLRGQYAFDLSFELIDWLIDTYFLPYYLLLDLDRYNIHTVETHTHTQQTQVITMENDETQTVHNIYFKIATRFITPRLLVFYLVKALVPWLSLLTWTSYYSTRGCVTQLPPAMDRKDCQPFFRS